MKYTSDRETNGAGGASEQSVESRSQVQFAGELAGMPYEQQVAAIQPPMPIMPGGGGFVGSPLCPNPNATSEANVQFSEPQQSPTPEPTSADQPTESAEVSPDDRIASHAILVLSNAEPLNEADFRLLAFAFQETEIIEAYDRRNRARDTVEGYLARRDLRDLPAGYPEPTSDDYQAVFDVNEFEEAQADLERQLEDYGMTEEGLCAFLEREFPEMVTRRARELAIEQLTINEELVQREIMRYWTGNVHLDGLRSAAREIRDAARRCVPSLAGSRDVSIEARQQASTANFQALREILETSSVRFPVLFQLFPANATFHEKLTTAEQLVLSSDEELAEATQARLSEVSDDIAESIDNVDSGDLPVWQLTDIIELTKFDLGIQDNDLLNGTVDEYLRRAATEDTSLADVCLTALAITAGLLAIICPMSGAALLVAIAAAVPGTLERIERNQVEEAANNTALDPVVADISSRDPDYAWLAVDILCLGLDVAAARSLFRAIRIAAPALDRSRTRLLLQAFGLGLPPGLGDEGLGLFVRMALDNPVAARQLVRLQGERLASLFSNSGIPTAVKQRAARELAQSFGSGRHSADEVGGFIDRLNTAENAEQMGSILDEAGGVVRPMSVPAASRGDEHIDPAALEAELDELSQFDTSTISDSQLESIADIEAQLGLPTGDAGTPSHMATRWREYRARSGDWPFERWQNTYLQNLVRARNSSQAVAEYHQRLGWGRREVTVHPFGRGRPARRLDIADADRAVEHKLGYVKMRAEITQEIAGDAELVRQGWEISWYIDGRCSQSVRDALTAADISFTETMAMVPIQDLRRSQ